MKRVLHTVQYRSTELRSTLGKCLHHTRCQSTIALDSPVSDEALSKAKPFEEMPGPKPLPFIGNMHRYLPKIGEYSCQWHESSIMKFHQYGPIVREVFWPNFAMVHLYDSRDIETVTRNEGRLPRREFFVGMKTLREQKPHVYPNVGVAAGNGEGWHYLRSRSQRVLMRPQIMKQFIPQMNVIADDVVRRIRLRRDEQMQVPALLDELFKWALESVVFVMFKRRLGCLADDLTEDSPGMKYIRAVNGFFSNSAKVEMAAIPIWRRYPKLSLAFRKLEKVHTFFFESAMEYVKEAMTKLETEASLDENNLSLIEMLLRQCSPEEASVMAIDAMAAGIDTTSLSTAYVLRHLAANPEAQRRLQADIDRVLPNRAPLTVEALEELPYLRACIKESMRLTPVVQGTSRTLDKDIVLSGYRVPANTLLNMNYYVTSVQESHFPEANKYKPERWMRDSSSIQAKESFAFQPFGFGPRMCIGRRIAELEMFSLLTKLMQNFWVENKHHNLEINFQLVMMIKSPLLYEFHERTNSNVNQFKNVASA